MPTKITTPVIVCLGDSLTAGATGAEVTPWPQLLRSNLAPNKAVANQGVGGAVVADMQATYTARLKGLGYYGCVLMAGINDIIAGTSAATIWTAYEALVDEMLADGLKVLCLTAPPFGLHASWTAGKQTELLALRTSILAKSSTGLTKHDTYTTMGEPGTPANLNPPWSIGDGLHLSQAGIVVHEADIRADVDAM